MTLEFLGFLPRVFLGIAVVAWTVVFLGFLVSVFDQFRPRAASAGRAS